MANHKSALKRIRSNETKKSLNKLQHKTTRNAIKKLKDLTGLRAVDMHSDNIMARHGQNLVIVDLGLFRKDATAEGSFFNMQESRSFSIKIRRNPRK